MHLGRLAGHIPHAFLRILPFEIDFRHGLGFSEGVLFESLLPEQVNVGENQLQDPLVFLFAFLGEANGNVKRRQIGVARVTACGKS